MATYFENLVFLVTLCIVLIGQVLGGVDYMDGEYRWIVFVVEVLG